MVRNEFTLEIKLWIRKCTLNSLVSLGVRSEVKPQEVETQQLVTPREGPAHQSVLVQDILTKGNGTTLEYLPCSPNLAAADFLWSPYWNQHHRDDAFVMVLTFSGMPPKSWKGFHKEASRYVSDTYTVFDRNVLLHKGIITKET